MTTQSRDDVLYAFAVEPAHDRTTLDRYLREHPDLVSDLLELSFQLRRSDIGDRDRDGADADAPDAEDEAFAAAAWSRRVARSAEPAGNPLARLDAAQRRAIAHDLGLRMQVVSLFREGRIALDTVPRRLLSLMAGRLGMDVPSLLRGLAIPAPSLRQAYKSDDRPAIEAGIPFPRALAESGASPEAIAGLLADD